MEFLINHWLDILTTVLGLLYIWLEFRASIALWFVGIAMPALDIFMAVYYTVASVYGYVAWSCGKGEHQERPITHMPARLYVPTFVCFLAAWGITYYILIHWTNSTVPLLDSFTNALSFVGLWALARKYLEQWFFWIVVDVVCSVLYVQKGIPFKAGLYGLYVVIAIAGYFKWKQLSKQLS